MIAAVLVVLFVAAAMLASAAIFTSLRGYGARLLALSDDLAATSATRGFAYQVTERRMLRSDVNVVILPVRKESYRLPVATGLRAAA